MRFRKDKSRLVWTRCRSSRPVPLSEEIGKITGSANCRRVTVLPLSCFFFNFLCVSFLCLYFTSSIFQRQKLWLANGRAPRTSCNGRTPTFKADQLCILFHILFFYPSGPLRQLWLCVLFNFFCIFCFFFSCGSECLPKPPSVLHLFENSCCWCHFAVVDVFLYFRSCLFEIHDFFYNFPHWRNALR